MMGNEDRWYLERKRMVDSLIAEGYLSKPEVIEAMLKVPRHEFIPEPHRVMAYADHPIAIGHGQTISAPHMVAMMTELLEVGRNDKILEVGAGSGYQAAILAEIAKDGKIITLERIPELAEFARNNLERLGYKNVEVICKEGSTGYREEAPYDKIIVTAAAPDIPKSLFEQLANNGIMLIPVGGKLLQTLKRVRKKDNEPIIEDICGCVFVPLIGEEGWKS